MKRVLSVAIITVGLTACAQHPLTADQKTERSAAHAERTVSHVQEWIRQIVKADYEGDRVMLDRLYGEADAFLGDAAIESRVRYWKGFAKWRRAINGANETVTPTDLASDVEIAVDQLRRSGEIDSEFVDARIGEMQCLGLMLFFDRTRVGDDRIVRLRTLMGDLAKTASDNPRYVWAWGMAYFTVPPEKGGGPARVIPAYLRALDAVRSGVRPVQSPLDPTWGEAELCINLAYSYLNQQTPELALAKKYVDEAIELVPNWHYARDILRPQIEAAATKAGPSSRPTPTSNQTGEEKTVRLGNFSVSLSVKDIAASRAFYEKLGFRMILGDQSMNWLILQNETSTIGLFQGMFSKNIMTFNPGWDRNGGALPDFDDVREIQRTLKSHGITPVTEADEAASGPASLKLVDPDGNEILIDQHVPSPRK